MAYDWYINTYIYRQRHYIHTSIYNTLIALNKLNREEETHTHTMNVNQTQQICLKKNSIWYVEHNRFIATTTTKKQMNIKKNMPIVYNNLI